MNNLNTNYNKSQQLCLHLNTKIKIKIVEFAKGFPYIVSVTFDIVVRAIITLSEYPERFCNFFNSGSTISKAEIT